MKNLVMSAAVGLNSEAIEFFIKSLRKFYFGDVCILVDSKDIFLKEKIKSYNCKFYEVDVNKNDIQLKRYEFYLKFLNNKKYDYIFMCDCRDIYFQSNPFNYKYKGSINFFLEDTPINQCKVNSKWIYKTFGKKVFDEMRNTIICCSGTVLGTQSSITQYLILMNKMIKKFPFKKRIKYFLTFRRDKEGRGCDQGYCNYIVHKKLIKDIHLYFNHNGPVATVLYLKEIKFNKNSYLTNSAGENYLIVHQYDKRWNEFSRNINLIKKKLGLN